MKEQYLCLADDVKLGKNVKLSKFINLYGCTIQDNTKIGAFVEIQKGAVIGKNCKISSHTFICEGVIIADGCFIGHSVVFINDNSPQAVNEKGILENEKEWKPRFVKTKVGQRVSIGSNVTILGDITIGDGAMIGAGSVVTKHVPAKEVWVGNPARFLRKITEK
ncbi:MAG: acetyltransferase [Omnitrophica WOR_2 bacterium RIFCSPHIGHO2_01_FULL_48_9]|nr:MAG: acetyltransferase [Omnitrophica WOR_2 bacterium RIFCSPHIGHO2_02_FULL_48_11]OGX32013.1 MAG: acetyltransferase [Omnitrophica WOR_2 bacterium RIFCSPHIGHO2_01_FULL_48_9]